MKAFILTILATTTLVLTLTACSPQQPEQQPQQETPQAEQQQSEPQQPAPADFKARDYTGYPELDEILNAIARETLQTTDDLQSQLDAFFAACDDSWEGYLANKEQLTDWYATALQESADLYAFIQAQTDAYHQLLINNPEYAEYKVWNDALSESYGIWNDALSDYYSDWNDMFSDIYRDCDDMIGDGYDVVSYSEYQDTWDEFYEARQDAWDEMYDLRQNAWDDLYKTRQDTWGELYSRR